MEIQIQAIHFNADEKLEAFLKEKLNKLSQFYDNILGAEVFLKIDKAKTNGNKVVDIRLNIPGKDVFAAKQADSFEKAGDEAVEALRKQIIKHKEKALA